MEYTIKLSAPSWPELADAILEMARQIEGGASSPVEAQRMAAAVTAAANAAANAAPEASSQPPAASTPKVEEKPAEAKSEPEAAAPEVALEDVRAIMIRVGREVGREKAKELIEAHGAAKLTDVPAERLGELLEAARAALGVSE